MTPSTPTDAKSIVDEFFTAFGAGDLDHVLALAHEDIEIVATGPDSVPWYGTYHGRDGLQQFLDQLGGNTQTEAFSVDWLVSEQETVFAAGHLKHRITSTGNVFESDWALRCAVREEAIIEYQFFEDTAAAAAAFD
jgi:ketosteroid isomerase-like protein